VNQYEIQTKQIVEDLQLDARIRCFDTNRSAPSEVKKPGYTLSIQTTVLSATERATTINIVPNHGYHSYTQRIYINCVSTGQKGYCNERGAFVIMNPPDGLNHFLVQYHSDRPYPVAPPENA
jgi:hypothetical protein